jgi:hypothetical protein
MAMQINRATSAPVAMLWTLSGLLAGCAGSGVGLDVNGNPLSADSSAPEPLTAEFQSIQDNVFTPICTRCHIGAGAPEGLQLDQAHSYALLVGVPSAEAPSVLRVKPGDPDHSYIIQKLQGSSGIVGVQMPFGGPYLPQSTIDVIRQWIANGASPPPTAAVSMASVSHEIPAAAPFAVIATMPLDAGAVSAPLSSIAIGFSDPPDASYLNGAVHLLQTNAAPAEIPVLIVQAQGNPATVLLTPVAPLAPGAYRVTLRGGGAYALTSVHGAALPADYSFTFTVEAP